MLRFAVPVMLFASVAVAETYKIEGGALHVPHPITYDAGKLKDSMKAIEYVKGYLETKTYISTLRIEVHTDAQGADSANQALSEKRALAVAKALVGAGVDCKRLIAVGFGETKPVGDNGTAEGRAANRRTMFVNAALRGKAIGGMPVDGGGKVAGDPCK